MLLDIKTLIVMMLAGFVTLGIMLFSVRRSAAYNLPLRYWNGAVWSITGGWFLIALRGILPDFATVVLANTLIFLALALMYCAVESYVGRKPRHVPVFSLIGIAFLLLSLFQLMGMSPPLRATVTSLPGGAAALLIAVRLAGKEGVNVPSRRSTAALIALTSLLFILRGLDAWFFPENYQNLYQPRLLQVVSMLFLFLTLLGAGFGFILMNMEHLQGRLSDQASHDVLTGALSRRAFVDLATHELERARRLGTPTALLVLDLDHFKTLNDHFGHSFGDEVLAHFASIVDARRRNSDIFGRIGGEEFCLLLPNSDQNGAMQVAETIRESFHKQAVRTRQGDQIFPSVSIGLAVSLPTSPCHWQALFDQADEALYQAKHQGRNQTVAT